jgi:phospholipid transport system substrate-binding protein
MRICKHVRGWVRIMALSVLALAPIGDIGDAKAESSGASAVATSFQSGLVEVMKVADKLSVKQRYDKLAPLVDRTFHVPLMAQISAGHHWDKATTDQRKALIMAFRRMSVATLATLFDGYSGEVFTLDSEKPGPSKTTLVLTTLVKSDKSTVKIAYVGRLFHEGWRLIDVVVDSGISELKVRRSEYNLVLKEKGVTGLIGLLNGKADQLISQ